MRAYYEKNRAKILVQRKEYREANPEKVKAAVSDWYSRPENKAKRREYFKEYCHTEPFQRAIRNYAESEKGKRRAKEYGKNWRKEKRHLNCAKSTAYKAGKIRRIPSWHSEADDLEIKALYEEAARLTRETGIVHHVDHILPLRGRLVSGFHTPSNLRVIPATANLRKGSKLIPA